METWTTVGIPSIGLCDLLHPLVADLLEQNEFDEFMLIDNSETGKVLEFYRNESRVTVAHHPEWTITQMWNAMWAHTKVQGTARGIPSNAVILNDDIRIPKNFISRLVQVLRSDDEIACAYPNYRLPLNQDGLEAAASWTPTKGTYKDGGMWGCAFALKGELLNVVIPPMDEQFRVWCGDDDLVEQIRLAGRLVVRVNTLPLEHQASSSFNQMEGIHQLGWDDVERFRRKYGHW